MKITTGIQYILFLRLIDLSRPGNSHRLAFLVAGLNGACLYAILVKIFKNLESWSLMGFVSVILKFSNAGWLIS